MSSLGFFFQAIHLWFEDFSIQDSNTCEADFITLKDELGIIGESCAVAGHKNYFCSRQRVRKEITVS